MAFGKSDERNSPITPNIVTPASSSGLGLGSSSPSNALGAFLGSGTKIMGQLSFTGPVELDGQVEGEIVAQDKLTIGEAAIVKGTVHGSEILVKGTVQGDIFASKKLILRKPARIIGNISAPSLNIEEGVTFDGKCSMNMQIGQKPQPNKIENVTLVKNAAA
ncbi:MAG: polymer-forming cytoskeletal protein [bacterium]|nr:polymer-forming cytoskeletal protein [bacterium]